MKSIFVIILFSIALSTAKCLEKNKSSEFFRESKSHTRHFSSSKSHNLDYYDDDSDDLLIDESYNDSMFFSNIKLSSGVGRAADTNETLNCFGLSNTWANYLDSFFKKDEDGSDALKVFFYGNSRHQRERVVMRHGDLFLIEKTNFDIRRRTIFIVHGFVSHGEDWWIMDMEKALLKWGDVNIFVVDWSDGANTWNYVKAAINTRTVGRQIVTFISQIIDNTLQWDGPDSSEWGTLHFIGHSLGAHICGYAAQRLKRLESQWLVRRITGLDPAQPCFRNSHLALRLDPTDADYVDVIHTNGRILSEMGLGLPFPLGHVDFYPNGGGTQPGCFLPDSSFWNYIPLPIEKITNTICSHGRSYLYLTESVLTAVDKNCTFWAQQWDMSFIDFEELLSVKCDYKSNRNKCMEMGINAEKYDSNGTYFTITGSSSPYCNIDSDAIDHVKALMGI